MTQLTRRQMLVGTTAAAFAAAIPFAASSPVGAAAPPIGRQAPGFYRYKVGSIEVTVVVEGINRVPLTDAFVLNAKKDQVSAALAAGFMDKDIFVAPYNPIVVNTGAINFGNPVLAQKDQASGEPRGVSVDLARELGGRLGVSVELVAYDAAGKVFDALRTGAWDIAFLAIDPARATEIVFTAPYVVIEGTYLVPADSPLRTIQDIDRDGVRVAVGNKSAYDLYLTRTLKRAQLIRVATSPEAIDVFLKDKLEAAAGVKQPLLQFAKTHPNVRVMDGRFMVIEQAMGTPKGREAGALYLREFVEEMKASGFVARGLEKSGQGDATVAPRALGQ